MAHSPVITSILVVPGPGAISTQVPPTGAFPTIPGEIVSVGLVLDEHSIAWGECAVGDYHPTAEPFRAAEGIATIEKSVVPALQGQPLAAFRPLAAQVDALTEIVAMAVSETPRKPQPENQPPKISRRDLFSGRLGSAGRPAETGRAQERAMNIEQPLMERPIHPALRYGVSQALLAAVAMARGLTMLEIISQEYGLPLPATAVPLHAEIGQPQAVMAEPLISHRIASLGYTTLGQDPETQLGHNSELLQRFVRQLREQIAAIAPGVAGRLYRPVIHLDVRGALGRLYDDNPGKILGALYGLEQAAGPYQVRLANPVLKDSHQATIDLMRQLKEYVRLRRMKLELVVEAGIHSLADARAMIESDAAHMIHLNAPRLGSLHQTVEAVLAGRQKGVGVLLGNIPVNSGDSARFAAHVALATQPDLLMVQPGQGGDVGIVLAHNEMARALTWLAARQSLPS